MSIATPGHDIRPACAVCGKAASRIQLFDVAGVWRLVYDGLEGGTGPSGMEITPDLVSAIISGFAEPYSKEKIRRADFYDDGGFCLECEKFYCRAHWDISATGGGRCPNGHFKSLDPHWSPNFDDDQP
jgi:hypothetical protein